MLSDLSRSRIGFRVLVVALALSVLPIYASARVKKRTRPAKKTHLHRSPVARRRGTGRLHGKYRALRGRLGFTAKRRRLHMARTSYRSTRYRRRAPATEISSHRAEQIQEALVQAGDLHETPTGRWDAQTREAMREYQSSNGFQATGLPDAKSLMKLGLGPHPLPADLEPRTTTKPALSLPSPNSPASKVAANSSH
jgi:hypothetical protein